MDVASEGQSSFIAPPAGHSCPLLTMPSELLWLIFDLVREENGEKQMIGGINKALLPYTRSNLYRKIHLAKWKQLRRLTAALERDEELGDLVNELSVAITSTAGNIEETPEDEDQLEVVESLLFALNSLETLTTSTPRVTEVVLDEYFAECGLPSLFRLSIEDSFADFSDPYDPVHYLALDLYPRLFDLRLDITTRDPSSITPSLAVDPEITFPDVMILRTLGPLSSPGVAGFLESFPEVECLKLYDSSSQANFNIVLQGVNPAVTELTLLGEIPLDEPVAPVHALTRKTLSRFNKLELLYVGVADIFPSFLLDALKDPLPLQRLHFGFGAYVSAEKLRELIEGSASRGRLSSLKVLDIEIVDGEKGTTIEGDHDGCPYFGSEYTGPPRPWPDWQPPFWTAEFTMEGAEQLVAACTRAGVALEGSLEKALEVEAGFIEEIDWCTSWEMAMEEELRYL